LERGDAGLILEADGAFGVRAEVQWVGGQEITGTGRLVLQSLEVNPVQDGAAVNDVEFRYDPGSDRTITFDAGIDVQGTGTLTVDTRLDEVRFDGLLIADSGRLIVDDNGDRLSSVGGFVVTGDGRLEASSRLLADNDLTVQLSASGTGWIESSTGPLTWTAGITVDVDDSFVPVLGDRFVIARAPTADPNDDPFTLAFSTYGGFDLDGDLALGLFKNNDPIDNTPTVDLVVINDADAAALGFI